MIDAKCQTQLDAAKQALCECGQSVATPTARASLRASTPSCAGLPAQKQGGGGGGQDGKQRSCDGSSQTDYCKAGFDKYQADKKAKMGQKRPGGDGH